jgi:tungstate transport system ATP-binding protein
MKPFEISSIQDLKLYRGKRLVLDIPHLELKTGAVTILSGPNGSGKTTLLKILAGLIKADEGVFKSNSREISCAAAPKEFSGLHLYMHQVAYMFSGTVVDNLSFGLRQRRYAKDIIDSKIEKILKWASLNHLADREAKTLSTGEQHQVALARARILDPCLLLLDETTAHMDKSARIRTYQLIKDLQNDGVTMLFATHEEESQHELNGVKLGIADGKLL